VIKKDFSGLFRLAAVPAWVFGDEITSYDDVFCSFGEKI